jgi:hypothetical protein
MAATGIAAAAVLMNWRLASVFTFSPPFSIPPQTVLKVKYTDIPPKIPI